VNHNSRSEFLSSFFVCEPALALRACGSLVFIPCSLVFRKRKGRCRKGVRRFAGRRRLLLRSGRQHGRLLVRQLRRPVLGDRPDPRRHVARPGRLPSHASSGSPRAGEHLAVAAGWNAGASADHGAGPVHVTAVVRRAGRRRRSRRITARSAAAYVRRPRVRYRASPHFATTCVGPNLGLNKLRLPRTRRRPDQNRKPWHPLGESNGHGH
jgi:hypothetical protein